MTAFFNFAPFLMSPSKASLPGVILGGGGGADDAEDINEGPPPGGGGGGGGGGGAAIFVVMLYIRMRTFNNRFKLELEFEVD